MTSSEITTAIQDGRWPQSFNSYQRDQIKKLYDQKQIRAAQRMFQNLINNPITKDKTLL